MKTERKFALIAGFALILMAVAAAFSFGYIHNSLVIPGNSESIVSNIQSLGLLFKAEIAGWILILILDIVVAWALYNFFRNENKKLSLAMAWIRVIYSGILGFAIFNFIQILQILNGVTETVSVATTRQVMNHLLAFENTWSLSLILFGVHLLLLGMLVFRSKRIHLLWGILLVFAAISYIGIHSAKQLFPEFDSLIKTAETILMLPMTLGEVGFAFWLVIRGGKPKTVYSNKKLMS